MLRQRFEVQHLRTGIIQRGQQARFARASGTANHAPLQRSNPARYVLHHCSAKRFVAAFQQGDLEAYLVQHQRQRAAALAAAPAVGKRLPVLGFVNHFALNVPRDITRRNRRTAFFGFKRVDLLVSSADEVALFIIERGPVHGARQMVLSVFTFTARVDEGVKLGQPVNQVGCCDGYQAHFRSFFSSAHTLASMAGCACALG